MQKDRGPIFVLLPASAVLLQLFGTASEYLMLRTVNERNGVLGYINKNFHVYKILWTRPKWCHTTDIPLSLPVHIANMQWWSNDVRPCRLSWSTNAWSTSYLFHQPVQKIGNPDLLLGLQCMTSGTGWNVFIAPPWKVGARDQWILLQTEQRNKVWIRTLLFSFWRIV